MPSTLTISAATTSSSANNCVCIIYNIYHIYRREIYEALNFSRSVCSSFFRSLYIGKQKKKVEKRVAESQSQESQGSQAVSVEELKAALARIRTEPVPASPEAREQYFMSQVGMGETLCMQGALLALFLDLWFHACLIGVMFLPSRPIVAYDCCAMLLPCSACVSFPCRADRHLPKDGP
jgi:hypothetical protein